MGILYYRGRFLKLTINDIEKKTIYCKKYDVTGRFKYHDQKILCLEFEYGEDSFIKVFNDFKFNDKNYVGLISESKKLIETMIENSQRTKINLKLDLSRVTFEKLIEKANKYYLSVDEVLQLFITDFSNVDESKNEVENKILDQWEVAECLKSQKGTDMKENIIRFTKKNNINRTYSFNCFIKDNKLLCRAYSDDYNNFEFLFNNYKQLCVDHNVVYESSNIALRFFVRQLKN